MKTQLARHAIAFPVGSLIGLAAVSLFYLNRADVEVPQAPRSIDADSRASPAANAFEAATGEADSSRIGIVGSFHERVAKAHSYKSIRRSAWELERVFEDMRPEDAPAVLAMILEISDGQDAKGLQEPFFGKWGEIDGAAALAAAEAIEGRNRNALTKTVFNHWALADLRGAWDAAQVYLDDQSGSMANLGRGVIEEMARVDRDFLIRILNTGEKGHLENTIRDKLVETAFDEGEQMKLIASLNALEDRETRIKLQRGIYQRWGADDTDTAVEAILQIGDAAESEAAMAGFLRGWSKTDPSGAFDYAFANQDEPIVASTFRNLLSRKMGSASLEEKEALIEKIADAGLLDAYGRPIGYGLMMSSPEAAITFADRVSDKRLKQRAMATWAHRDLEAAHSHLERMEPGSERDKLSEALVVAVLRESDGGSKLDSILTSLSTDESRSQVIELALASAEAAKSAGMILPESVTTALKRAAESDPNLSAKGKASSGALFGE